MPSQSLTRPESGAMQDSSKDPEEPPRPVKRTRKKLANSGISETPMETGTLKPDILTKGKCDVLKNKFEAHLAGHKEVGQMTHIKEDRKKESVPMMDKALFKHFLAKFEDEQSRKQAKDQLMRLTKAQKEYMKQEELKRQQEIKRQQEQERLRLKKAEEEAKAEAEAAKKRQEEKEIERLRLLKQEQQELKKTTVKTKKSVIKRKAKPETNPEPESRSKQLPRLVSSSYSDMKRRIQSSFQSKSSTDPAPSGVPPVARPKVRKMLENPFEQKLQSDPDPAVQARRFFPRSGPHSLINDIKRKYDQEVSCDTAPTSPTSPDPPTGSARESKVMDAEQSTKEMEVEKTMVEFPVPEAKAKPKSPTPPKRSKEKIDHPVEEPDRAEDGGPVSKDDMQRYLLSHVLFNGHKSVQAKKEQPPVLDWLDTLEEDMTLEQDMLEDEYIKEMEKYLALFDSELQTKPKKAGNKKVAKSQKPEVRLKLVEVKDLKKKFDRPKGKANGLDPEAKVADPATKLPDLILDQSVDRVKEKFEKGDDNAAHRAPQAAVRPGRTLSKDLLSKFDSPEAAEALKKQREEEREIRRQQRLAQMEEERRKLEEERKRMEEELRKKEEELRRKEEERARKEEEERIRLEEAQRAEVAYQEMLKQEKAKAAARKAKADHERRAREKNEPAFKTNKVLTRIQHLFDKAGSAAEEEEPAKVKHVGSIKAKAQDLFAAQQQQQNSSADKPASFQDSSLSGMASFLGNVRNKFEAVEADDQPQPKVSRGVRIQKKNIPAAEMFELLQMSSNSCADKSGLLQEPQKSDWSWKKKDPKMLAAETALAVIKTSSSSSSSSGQSHRQKSDSAASRTKEVSAEQLMTDIQNLNKRLKKKDAVKEHELKMKEYADFMEEIQSLLSTPTAGPAGSSTITTQSHLPKPAEKEKKSLLPHPKGNSVSLLRDNLVQKFESGVNPKSRRDSGSFVLQAGNKRKRIVELIKGHRDHVPGYLLNRLSDIPDQMGDEEAQETYGQVLKIVDEFLTSPDTSREQTELKAKLEKLMEQMEEPEPNEDSRLTSSRQRIEDAGSFIKDMQEKLFGGDQAGAGPGAPKDEAQPAVVVHHAGTDRLRREYEKLNQVQEPKLTSAPRITTKKAVMEEWIKVQDSVKTPKTLALPVRSGGQLAKRDPDVSSNNEVSQEERLQTRPNAGLMQSLSLTNLPGPVYKSPYEGFKSEKEKKAAILAKYGVKPRTSAHSSASSLGSGSSIDEAEVEKSIREQREMLKETYGLNAIRDRRRQQRKDSGSDSVTCLRTLLSKLRGSREPDEPDSKRSFSDLKFQYERSSQDLPTDDQEDRWSLERSATFSNVRNVFESREFTRAQSNEPSGNQNNSISKSSSVHKLKNVFESGRVSRNLPDENDSDEDGSSSCSDDEDEDEDDEVTSSVTQRRAIAEELHALRSAGRNPGLPPVSRPSLLSRSVSSSGLADLDDKTKFRVSKTTSHMRSVFESQAPKVTFGGCHPPVIPPDPVSNKRSAQPKAAEGKSWMLDVINKYFDVIVEDEEEDVKDNADHDSDDHEDADEHPDYRHDRSEDEEDEEEDVEEEESSDDEDPEGNYQLTRSASSSRMRSLFRSAVHRSSSGQTGSIQTFKANLSTHLQLRVSTSKLDTFM